MRDNITPNAITTSTLVAHGAFLSYTVVCLVADNSRTINHTENDEKYLSYRVSRTESCLKALVTIALLSIQQLQILEYQKVKRKENISLPSPFLISSFHCSPTQPCIVLPCLTLQYPVLFNLSLSISALPCRVLDHFTLYFPTLPCPACPALPSSRLCYPSLFTSALPCPAFPNLFYPSLSSSALPFLACPVLL